MTLLKTASSKLDGKRLTQQEEGELEIIQKLHFGIKGEKKQVM